MFGFLLAGAVLLLSRALLLICCAKLHLRMTTKSERTFYYTLDDKTRVGPISIEELKAAVLNSGLNATEIKVWQEGQDDWMPLTDIPQFAEFTKSIPPPLGPKKKESRKKQGSKDNSFFESPLWIRWALKILGVRRGYLNGVSFLFALFLRGLAAWTLGAFLLGGLSMNLGVDFIQTSMDNLLYPVGLIGAISARVQRARSLGGASFASIVRNIDLIYLLYTVGLAFIPVAPEYFALIMPLEVFFGGYSLWTSYKLVFQDSYSPNKGGVTFLKDYLAPNTLEKKRALQETLDALPRLRYELNLPDDLAVVPRKIPRNHNETPSVIVNNPFYYLVAMSKKGTVAIKDWNKLSVKDQRQFYRLTGKFESISGEIELLKRDVDTELLYSA